jgi:ribosome-associated protein
LKKPTTLAETLSDGSSFIKLDQFLKFIGVVSTGGEAKALIQSGEVDVNGQMELRRGRKLINGDRVSISSSTFDVNL